MRRCRYTRALVTALRADLERQHSALRWAVLDAYGTAGYWHNEWLTRERWGW